MRQKEAAGGISRASHRCLPAIIGVRRFERRSGCLAVPATKWVSGDSSDEVGVWRFQRRSGCLAVPATKWVSGGSSDEVGVWRFQRRSGCLAVPATKWVSGGSSDEVGVWQFRAIPCRAGSQSQTACRPEVFSGNSAGGNPFLNWKLTRPSGRRRLPVAPGRRAVCRAAAWPSGDRRVPARDCPAGSAWCCRDCGLRPG
ncbi:hypothetical protein Pla8534_35970 [Lignipirellula cremea]|uniref:Uncharacterized protein n=1 Tax=Lignipirellula cremea TaxID=2528010 RepID=A0A518DVC1_9BACT|nr:hypothetical protein Pla8534_35970 [Lignipirellula cremea]